MSLSYEQIVADNSVKTISVLTIPADAHGAEIQADTNDVRYTLDGTIPTQTLGMILLKGDGPKEIPISELRKIKFPRGTASNANMNLQYFR